MRRFRRARRPLLALIVLVVALAIGYGVRACDRSETRSSGVGAESRSWLTHTGGRALSAALR